MRILFIDPMGDKESTGLNIGIAYCATAAMNAGHQASILDLVNFRDGDPESKIRNAVEKFTPQAIGISVTNMSFSNSKKYAAGIKRYFKGRIIIGGPEVSALGRKSLELMPEADIAVIGEGEETLPELLNALDKGLALGTVNGIVWRGPDGVTANRPQEFKKDLDSIPFPDYRRLFGAEGMDVYSTITSRGCPYGCIFCFSYLGRSWRSRSPENVVEELLLAKHSYGAKMFHICDASFNVDIKRVEAFCDLLIEKKVGLPWVIQGFRADRVSEEMIGRLAKAGCKRVWVGIETLDEEVFNGINKGETIAQIRNGIALMKKYKIEIFGYMLMGLPGDTLKKTLDSFDRARKWDLDLLAYSSCVPFTGTKIEEWVHKNAEKLSDSYDISSIGTQYGKIAFATKDFTEAERIKARKILNIKSGSYNEPGLNPIVFKMKKWLLILKYDLGYLPQRLAQSVRYRFRYKENIDSINLWRGVYFSRLPDGTWSAARTGEEAPAARYFLDLKRLTISEMPSGER